MASAVLVFSDDHGLPGLLSGTLDDGGFRIAHFGLKDFVALDRFDEIGCVLIDATADAAGGLRFLRGLPGHLKAILIAARASVGFAVEAARAGAFGVLQTPLDRDELRACVHEALAAQESPIQGPPRGTAAEACASLTRRQREILSRILDGQPNKIIAADLGISQRTAENHRAMVMRKLGASSISDLIQIALAAR